MCSVLRAALDLSTSTKPFDSVTAAHLLNLLLPQPHLSRALLLCAREQDLHIQLPPLPLQVSDAVVLELNTLAGKIHNEYIYIYMCVEYEKMLILLLFCP